MSASKATKPIGIKGNDLSMIAHNVRAPNPLRLSHLASVAYLTKMACFSTKDSGSHARRVRRSVNCLAMLLRPLRKASEQSRNVLYNDHKVLEDGWSRQKTTALNEGSDRAKRLGGTRIPGPRSGSRGHGTGTKPESPLFSQSNELWAINPMQIGPRGSDVPRQTRLEKGISDDSRRRSGFVKLRCSSVRNFRCTGGSCGRPTMTRARDALYRAATRAARKSEMRTLPIHGEPEALWAIVI